MEWSLKVMLWIEKAMYIVALNVLWLLGTILGLGFLGFFPSVYAIFKLVKEYVWFDSQPSLLSLVKEFFTTYKKSFFKANVAGYMYVSVSCILFINLHILQQNDLLRSFFYIPTIVMIIYVWSTATFFVPTMLLSDASFRKRIKMVLMAPLIIPSSFFMNLGILIALAVLTYVYSLGFFIFYVAMSIFLIYTNTSRELIKKDLIVV